MPQRAEIHTTTVIIDTAILLCSSSSECSKTSDFEDRINVLNISNITQDRYNLIFNLLNVTEEDNKTYTIEVAATYTYTLNGMSTTVPSFTLTSFIVLSVTQGNCI